MNLLISIHIGYSLTLSYKNAFYTSIENQISKAKIAMIALIMKSRPVVLNVGRMYAPQVGKSTFNGAQVYFQGENEYE